MTGSPSLRSVSDFASWFTLRSPARRRNTAISAVLSALPVFSDGIRARRMPRLVHASSSTPSKPTPNCSTSFRIGAFARRVSSILVIRGTATSASTISVATCSRAHATKRNSQLPTASCFSRALRVSSAPAGNSLPQNRTLKCFRSTWCSAPGGKPRFFLGGIASPPRSGLATLIGGDGVATEDEVFIDLERID